MLYLIIVSLIWAFSFGLIKGNLTNLDPNFVASARLVVATLVFAPFLKLPKLENPVRLKLLLIGACQYGIMYIAYFYAFQYLKAYEVALFTIFTPIYVTLFNDGWSGRFRPLNLLTAAIAVIGTGVIYYAAPSGTNLISGFLLVQLSNVCFAIGQIAYREVMKSVSGVEDREVFALLFLGAVGITALAAGFTTPWASLTVTSTQIYTIIYLGFLASGICFFLWNVGARKVAGGTLAIFNNIKVPLAVAASLLVFGEQADGNRLLLGGTIILAAIAIDAYWQKEAVQAAAVDEKSEMVG